MRKLVLTLIACCSTCLLAGAHTLAVPFFSDGGPNLNSGGSVNAGSAGFIGLQNISTAPVLIDVVYTFNVNGEIASQIPQRFQLGAGQGVSWRPFRDDPSEGLGRMVPNVLAGGKAFGSATISWRGGEFGAKTLTGRYVQLAPNDAFAHVLN